MLAGLIELNPANYKAVLNSPLLDCFGCYSPVLKSESKYKSQITEDLYYTCFYSHASQMCYVCFLYFSLNPIY
jgi:hypothetical protein